MEFVQLIYSFHQYMANCDYSFYIIISNFIKAACKMSWMLPKSSDDLSMLDAGSSFVSDWSGWSFLMHRLAAWNWDIGSPYNLVLVLLEVYLLLNKQKDGFEI
jgi:hypothetical protein